MAAAYLAIFAYFDVPDLAFLLNWERSAGTEVEQRFGPALPRTQKPRPNIPPEPVKVSSTRQCAGQTFPLHHNLNHRVGPCTASLVESGDECAWRCSRIVLIALFPAAMPSLGPERLRMFALDALEEAVADGEFCPVRRTWALRLALGYLASLHPRAWSTSEPYRDFWRSLSLEPRRARVNAMETALRAIYAWADVKRDDERVAIIRERARPETH